MSKKGALVDADLDGAKGVVDSGKQGHGVRCSDSNADVKA